MSAVWAPGCWTMTPEQPEAVWVALHVIDVLDELRIAYHVGGSFASAIHGIPRQTQDIDLVVALEVAAIPGLIDRLQNAFYVDAGAAREAIRQQGSFNLIHHQSGMKVDLFVLGDGPFDAAEFDRHRAEVVQTNPERRVFVKSPEDTILRKLQWYRLGGEVSDRQWSDVLGIVRVQGERLDRAYLQRWAGQIGVADLLARALEPASGS